jgi:hypothetical protein
MIVVEGKDWHIRSPIGDVDQRLHGIYIEVRVIVKEA